VTANAPRKWSLRRRLDQSGQAYRRLRSALALLPRRLDASDRLLPAIVILGAQKAGTSSLFTCLSEHPDVLSPTEKEVHYFDLNFARGREWYRAHFPHRSAPSTSGRSRGPAQLTLEASPYYLFHPAVPERLHSVLPDAKLIVMLRNPVNRAYSHYWHEYERGFERLPLRAALAAEEDRLRGEAAKLLADVRYRSFAHQHYSYVSRGLYVEQVRAWFARFPSGRFLFVKSEQLFADPEAQMARVLRFVGLPPENGMRPRPVNAGRYPPMDRELRESLTEYYDPHNRQLGELLGPDFVW
jgi:hypothetical protein